MRENDSVGLRERDHAAVPGTIYRYTDIAFLRGELDKNPSYVDLYSELGRCYFEQSRLSWQRGQEQYRRVVEMNPSLSKIASDLDETTSQYKEMCKLLSRIMRRS